MRRYKVVVSQPCFSASTGLLPVTREVDAEDDHAAAWSGAEVSGCAMPAQRVEVYDDMGRLVWSDGRDRW